jgi:hypothetical protein
MPKRRPPTTYSVPILTYFYQKRNLKTPVKTRTLVYICQNHMTPDPQRIQRWILTYCRQSSAQNSGNYLFGQTSRTATSWDTTKTEPNRGTNSTFEQTSMCFLLTDTKLTKSTRIVSVLLDPWHPRCTSYFTANDKLPKAFLRTFGMHLICRQ